MKTNNKNKDGNFNTNNNNQVIKDFIQIKKQYKEADILRKLAFYGIVVSTFATLTAVIIIPMLYNYTQYIQASLQVEVDFCRHRLNGIALEYFNLETQLKPFLHENKMYQNYFDDKHLYNKIRAKRYLNLDINLITKNISQKFSLNHKSITEITSKQNRRQKKDVYGRISQNQYQKLNVPTFPKPLKMKNYVQTSRYATAPILAPKSSYKPTLSFSTHAQSCLCAIGKAGLPGPIGIDGIPGRDGKQGVDGIPGEDAPINADHLTEFCFDCPVGIPGMPGQIGSPGCIGKPGPVGEPGEQGIQGAPGLPGKVGSQGDPGLPGLIGEPGEPGIIMIVEGLPGLSGPPGPLGEPGPMGPPGPPGKPGLQGPQGISGDNGNDGLNGIPGPIGDQGQPGCPGTKGGCDHCPPPIIGNKL